MNTSASKRSSAVGRNTILVLAIALAVLHQDFWWWDSETLVLGFMPIGLAYHACYSIMAACLWALAIKIAWPHHLEAIAEETHEVSRGFSVEEAQDTNGVGEF
jgi:hypothetical protein